MTNCDRPYGPIAKWLTAHLADFLHHCGVLDNEFNQREQRLLEYSTQLFSGSSYWQIGAAYLSYCPTFGRRYLEEFVGRISLDTEFKAHKVIQYVALPPRSQYPSCRLVLFTVVHGDNTTQHNTCVVYVESMDCESKNVQYAPSWAVQP